MPRTTYSHARQWIRYLAKGPGPFRHIHAGTAWVCIEDGDGKQYAITVTDLLETGSILPSNLREMMEFKGWGFKLASLLTRNCEFNPARATITGILEDSDTWEDETTWPVLDDLDKIRNDAKPPPWESEGLGTIPVKSPFYSGERGGPSPTRRS